MEGLFDFEQDGRYPLRRVPMHVRFNLDASGIRISLTAWALLRREEREQLLAMPSASTSAQERKAFSKTLATMLKPHAENPEAALEQTSVETAPAWLQTTTLPTAMVEHLVESALPSPTLDQWQRLSDLQRFTLIKLTRHGHQNTNLIPALHEFGIK